MSIITPPYTLSYLFEAETVTGQIIKQTPEDVSTTEPTKSAFYDVLQHKIKRFSLIGNGKTYTVDLTDGHYEINGEMVYPKTPPGRPIYDLIYYRQVQQRINVGPNSETALTPLVRYFIGWQTNIRGKNYKWELGVD